MSKKQNLLVEPKGALLFQELSQRTVELEGVGGLRYVYSSPTTKGVNPLDMFVGIGLGFLHATTKLALE